MAEFHVGLCTVLTRLLEAAAYARLSGDQMKSCRRRL